MTDRGHRWLVLCFPAQGEVSDLFSTGGFMTSIADARSSSVYSKYGVRYRANLFDFAKLRIDRFLLISIALFTKPIDRV